MKKIVTLFIIAMPLLLRSQSSVNEKGIQFEKSLTWEEVKAKAKAENKYIFVDCFATWCGPCKQMEEKIYSRPDVGNAYNSKFISVKLQMDKTSYDDPDVKAWYSTSTSFQQKYTVSAFPAFLFFSPEGKPLHKVVGSLSADDFLKMAREALDSTKQFYSLLRNFRPGMIDTSELKSLARMFKYNKEEELAGNMATDYLSRVPFEELKKADNLRLMFEFQQNENVLRIAVDYLNKHDFEKLGSESNIQFLSSLRKQPAVQEIVIRFVGQMNVSQFATKNNLELASSFINVPKVREMSLKYIGQLKEEKIYTKDMLEFIAGLVKKTEDPYFDLFYKHSRKVNQIVEKKDYAQHVVEGVILRNDINPVITATKEGVTPDFDGIRTAVEKKYGTEYAYSSILTSEVAFYKYWAGKYNSKWEEYFQYAIEKVEKYGTDTTSFPGEADLNNLAWDIFIYSTDINKIKVGINWMKGILRRKILEPGNSLDTYANLLYKSGNRKEAIAVEDKARKLQPKSKDLQRGFEKMVKGEPTWINGIKPSPEIK